MPNEVLFVIEIIICFSVILFCNRFFKKEGLIAWIAIASILANIITAKNVDAFGLTYTLGTVLFASTFLATDILTERFGKEEAKKGVFIGMFATLTFIGASQLALLYTPSSIDYADGSMRTLFSLNLRISISSVIMYFIANLADVYLYSALRQKMNGKAMWFRNNVSTILCNCLENFLFMGGAFLGIYDFKTVLIMAISTSIVEAVVGLCDTPFLYIATRFDRKKNNLTKEEIVA